MQVDREQRAEFVTAVATKAASDGPMLSFVIPAYNESANILPLFRRIVAACGAHSITDFEVVFIENGSWDESEAILRELHDADSRVKMVQLSRNFGYQGAITAGLRFARGQWVAVIDGDQQDPPELIPEMLAKTREGYEVVYGIRKTRREGLLLRMAYRLFYRLWRLTANIKIPLDASEFAVMSRRVVDVMNAMPERQRFTRGLRAWSGFRQTGIQYDRDSRGEGASKFNFLANVSLAMDALFAFSIVPIRVTILLGLTVTAGSLLVALANTFFWFLRVLDPTTITGTLPRGLTQINLMFSVLFGMVLLCLGVIGEYVGRIFEEVKDRPSFVVRDVVF
jgi:dolichol-phosphate mannosyltransferase